MNGIAMHEYESSEEDYETEVMLYDRSKTRKIRHHLTRVDPTYDDEDNSSLRPLMQNTDDYNYFDKEDTDEDNTYSVGEAVDTIGFGWFQIRLMLIMGFFQAAEALEMMLLSILAPTIRCLFHISAWKEAFITTVVFIGMMVGSAIWGWLADKYGRKFVIVASAVWISYFGFLSAFSPHYYWIIALRMLVGYGIGGGPQSSTLISEFMPSKYRAMCMCVQSPWWTVGSIFTILIAMVVMPTLGWRYLLAILSLPLIVFVFISRWLPESCRYYLTVGQRDKSLSLLYKIARLNKTVVPQGCLKDAAQTAKQGRIKDLLNKEFFGSTLKLWFLWFNVAFTYYGIVLMTAELFQSESEDGGKCEAAKGTVKNPHCGCKLLTSADYIDMMKTTVAEVPVVIFNVILLDKLGRKKTLALLYFLTAIFYILLFICTKRALMVVFIFGVRGCISGAFTGTYIYTAEFYPTIVRGLGLGCCSSVARIGAMVTPFICQVLLRYSLDFALGVYATTAVLSVVVGLSLPIETKGRVMRSSKMWS